MTSPTRAFSLDQTPATTVRGRGAPDLLDGLRLAGLALGHEVVGAVRHPSALRALGSSTP